MSTVLNLHTYAPMDHTYSRHANTAGAPLPRIPRRSLSSSRSVIMVTPSASAPSSAPPTFSRVLSAEQASLGASAVPTLLVVQPPTPPRSDATAPEGPAPDEASSSSSGSESYVQMNPRVRRVRTPKMHPFRPPEESTPTPAVLMAQNAARSERNVSFPVQDSGTETPRASTSKAALHINLDAIKRPLPLTDSSNSVTLQTVVRGESNRAVSVPNVAAATIARKKTGEPLKSSLKARRPAVRGDLSVVIGTGLGSTKSEPSTPMASKSVHFDSRLEHVKLFLAEQKPLAISREGSPTDTSGTESDFPSAIYGAKKAEQGDRILTINVANMPTTLRENADLALEDVTLSDDGTVLNGRVRVRNLAFEKWVAVRFTVDSWQTTSEVTAKYLDSIRGGVFDRFSFTIRLSDMLARIEDKTLFFAVRYNVVGREIWDNNSGENYKITFAKVPRARPVSASSSPESGLATLKSKLENVVKGQETVGGYMTQSSRKKPSSPSPFTLEASTSLSARYDFAASWKSPWTRSPPMSATPTKTSHSRNVTYPHALPNYSTRYGKQAAFEERAALTRGSPRILDSWDNDNSPMEQSSFVSSELEDTPVPIMSRRRSRNHQRGYFDLGISQSPSVRLTPTGSPTKGSPERTPEPPQALSHGMWFMARGGSEESTPSATSTSESSQQSSPSVSPSEDGLSFNYGLSSPSESDSYSSFLNKYCYYTGASESFLEIPADAIHRSHSASSVEEFLSSSQSPPYLLSPGESPTRSSSYDDVMSISSGSTTPTSRSMNFGSLVNSPQLLSAAH